ncbi:MAG: dockerin type I repeat-containing protein, partial [Oscillospiraceae bacterium]|nr:dockerin type I repeat-containing protein [Oscillospiraceae bacterium]
KKCLVIPAITAFCLSMAANWFSANAAYESPEDVTFTLRAVNGGYIPDDNPNRIYISPEDAASGIVIPSSMYIEADYADISYISAALESESEQIIFREDLFQNPTSFAYDTAQDFTLPDGTSFSTRFKPFCFGRLGSSGNYSHGSFSFLPNIQENNALLTWSYDLLNKETFSADFLGGSSDTFSFFDLDLEISPGIQPGTYKINYIRKDSFVTGATYLTSDDSYPDPDNPGKYISKYNSMVPELKSLEIVICENPPRITENPDLTCFRFAHDARDFSIEDFPAELTIRYGEDDFTKNCGDLLETFTAGNPESLYIGQPEILTNSLTFEGIPLENSDGSSAVLKYYIGQKGDANADGVVNSADASLILTYSADSGAGNEASLTDDTSTIPEDFAYFLADIDGESQNSGKDGSSLDAGDAALILQYAALSGSGQSVNWDDLL